MKKKKEKKEIPALDVPKPTTTEFVLGIVFVLAYFSQSFIALVLPDDISYGAAMTLQIIICIFLFVLAIAAFGSQLKRDILLWKENFKAYWQYILPKLGIAYIIFYLSNVICMIVTQQLTSVNQSSIEAMPKWFIIPISILWAPVVEELLFRGILRRLLKNKKVFIVVSAIIFGLLHSISEATLFNVVITAIPYAVIGGFLAYLYAKTNNLTNNIFVHMLQNTIAVLLMLLA